MSRNITTYGVEADERQQADHYKAGAMAFRILLGASLAGYIVSWFMENDALELTLGALFLIGLNAYGLLLDRSGWFEYVRERIETDEQVRRRAWRQTFQGAAMAIVINAAYHHIADDMTIGRAFTHALPIGIVVVGVSWWMELRRKKPKGDQKEHTAG